MAKDLFNRYIWLVDTIYRAGRITFEEINEKWLRNSMSEGNDLPLKTFHNHRHAIEDMFDINIVCDKKDGYRYYIENADDMEKGGVRTWLLNTFAVNNLINESHHLKRRIVFEQIPSGQKFLTPIIEAMRDGLSIEITYKSFWRQTEYTTEVEPYFVKVFRQRWYVIGFCNERDSIRTFALDRILTFETSDNKFTYPKEFDPDAWFADCFGIITEDIKAERVRVKVYGKQRWYFHSLPLHHSQNESETTEDYSIFEYHIRPTFDFRRELLSHGGAVEVLSPQWFREEMADEAADMAEIYGKVKR